MKIGAGLDSSGEGRPILFVEPPTQEWDTFKKAIVALDSASLHGDLFRYNLDAEGAARLMRDGRGQLTDMNGDMSVRVFMLYRNRQKFTLWWPGGLGFHLQILPFALSAFRDATALHKYTIFADVNDGHGLPRDISVRRIDDWLKAIRSDGSENTMPPAEYS